MSRYEYTNAFNKRNYKTYSFRVRKDNLDVINKLNTVDNKNKYIASLINNDIHSTVLTIKQIKDRIKPVIKSHNIKEVYLFGSYSRGEANSESDVDLYCDRGDIQSLFQHVGVIHELEDALGKKVDCILIGSTMDDYFKQQLQEDMIRIC